MEIIDSMQPPNRDGEDDSFFWLPSSNGCFTVKSAYLNSAFPINTSSDLLRKKYGDNQRMRRCFTDSDICKRCGQAVETTLHAIHDCPYVSGLWRRTWVSIAVPHMRLLLMIGINLTKDGLRLMLTSLSGKTLNTWRVGRLARNENGNWLFGFAKHLGKGCVDHAEIWSIFFGIITDWEKGFKHDIVESDNRNVINLICNGYDGPHPL
ncbi:reverse transcriptase [Senna tora]|uniref:Reverse transcriptase n=1 Tax=Senna tora TaxID=362788 RepID=A0A834T576_9FABA|nr:reverse transcriptase [Senna tora]